MMDKKIDVIINLANSLGAAFVSLTAALTGLWQTGHLLTPLGFIVYSGYLIVGVFTVIMYVWAFKLASNELP